MKSKISLLFVLLALLTACKEEKAETTNPAATETTVKATNEITLSNYSDENWNKGVGITYKMFLADNTPENLNLIKNGKELEFANGKKIPYVGYEVKGTYIQIMITEKPDAFASAAEYPNTIKIN